MTDDWLAEHWDGTVRSSANAGVVVGDIDPKAMNDFSHSLVSAYRSDRRW